MASQSVSHRIPYHAPAEFRAVGSPAGCPSPTRNLPSMSHWLKVHQCGGMPKLPMVWLYPFTAWVAVPALHGLRVACPVVAVVVRPLPAPVGVRWGWGSVCSPAGASPAPVLARCRLCLCGGRVRVGSLPCGVRSRSLCLYCTNPPLFSRSAKSFCGLSGGLC